MIREKVGILSSWNERVQRESLANFSASEASTFLNVHDGSLFILADLYFRYFLYFASANPKNNTASTNSHTFITPTNIYLIE